MREFYSVKDGTLTDLLKAEFADLYLNKNICGLNSFLFNKVKPIKTVVMFMYRNKIYVYKCPEWATDIEQVIIYDNPFEFMQDNGGLYDK